MIVEEMADQEDQMIADIQMEPDEDMQIEDKSFHESQLSEFQANQRGKEQMKGHLNRV